MFTIEHGFDATLITIIDEGQPMLREDLIIRLSAEGAFLRQFDQKLQDYREMAISYSQFRDLTASLELPEGMYQLQEE